MYRLLLLILLVLLIPFILAFTEVDFDAITIMFCQFWEAFESKNVFEFLWIFRPESTLVISSKSGVVRANGIVEIRDAIESFYTDFGYHIFCEESFIISFVGISENFAYIIWEASYNELDLDEPEDEVISFGKCFGSIFYYKHNCKWYIPHAHFVFLSEK